VFLLDEPTNNLDFAGLDRLERFLDALPGGVVVVSHDRAFLDRTVTRIVEVQEESHRAVEYAGGWSDYVEQRELARSQQYEAFDRYKSEQSRLKDRLREQRQWAVSGVSKEKKKSDGDKMARDFRINRTEKQASKVRITEKALANLEAVDKPWEGWRLQLQFAPEARSGDVVARLDGAVVHRGTFTLGPVDLEIAWQERLAIVGPNGGGKTTLLKTLLGELALVAGQRFLGPGVKVGTMDQARDLFAGDEPVLHTFMREASMPELAEARSLLAKFGLVAEHVGRAGGRLSPGERSRATLATLMATGVNCLVLDEPTNHLDLAAIEQLEIAVNAFRGTVLLVTHDRRLLEAVAVTRTVHVEDGKVLPPS
jgi:ATPase subunit of ABC transporter with duplicated ATPase domains